MSPVFVAPGFAFKQIASATGSLTQLPLQRLVICSTKIPHQLGCPFPYCIYNIYNVALLSYQLYGYKLLIYPFCSTQQPVTRKKMAQMSSSCMSNVHVMSKILKIHTAFLPMESVYGFIWPSSSHDVKSCSLLDSLLSWTRRSLKIHPLSSWQRLGLGICKTTKRLEIPWPLASMYGIFKSYLHLVVFWW